MSVRTRVIMSGGILASGVTLCMVLVVGPWLENLSLGRAQLSRAHSREVIELLSRSGDYDPYLRGHALTTRARAFRALKRQGDALNSYRAALRNRVPPETMVEVGLYLMECGEREEGLMILARAAEFSEEFVTAPTGEAD